MKLKRSLMLAAVAGLSITVPVLAQSPAPLEAFLSYTFVGELAAPTAADRIAWTELHQGRRNIWYATAPDYRPRRLTNGTDDDGQELSDLAFSPDGRVLAWTHGAVEHNPFADGLPAANPASVVTQPSIEIWASVDGGAPVKVADGEGPKVSASGRIAFLRDNQVWTVGADGTDKPQKLFYDRGRSRRSPGRPTASASPSCRIAAITASSASMTAPTGRSCGSRRRPRSTIPPPGRPTGKASPSRGARGM